VFDQLPDEAKRIVRKYSGEWAGTQFAETYARINREALAQLKADPRRHVVFPSREDAETARRVFGSIAQEWADGDAHRRELLQAAEKEQSALRPED
jgi:TRAP-type C4-dicarboxylate transport system substrate-binding protein